jgi:hypothetical protein
MFVVNTVGGDKGYVTPVFGAAGTSISYERKVILLD